MWLNHVCILHGILNVQMDMHALLYTLSMSIHVNFSQSQSGTLGQKEGIFFFGGVGHIWRKQNTFKKNLTTVCWYFWLKCFIDWLRGLSCNSKYPNVNTHFCCVNTNTHFVFKDLISCSILTADTLSVFVKIC